MIASLVKECCIGLLINLSKAFDIARRKKTEDLVADGNQSG